MYTLGRSGPHNRVLSRDSNVTGHTEAQICRHLFHRYTADRDGKDAADILEISAECNDILSGNEVPYPEIHCFSF